jgi:hypothetical protein
MSELTDIMMIQVARLLPEEYRGIYAERAKAPIGQETEALEHV